MTMKMSCMIAAGAAVLVLAAGSGVQAQDTATAPPQNVWFAARVGGGPGPMEHEAIGFLGFEAGLDGKTVAGAPFSASFSTSSTQTLADGNQIQRNSTGSIARDSQGRTRREMTLPAIGAFMVIQGNSVSHVTFLNDPVAGTRYVLEDEKKIAQQMPEPPDRAEFAGKRGHGGGAEAAAEKNEVVTTSLGTQTVGGVSAEGTRYTRTIPAGEIGNVKPIVVVTERWYSPDLQMVVMTKRSDPRSGDTVFQMTSIARTEPAATLFQVPADYTVAQAPVHVRGAVRIAGPPPPEE
jgi:hypothetical protein